MNNNTSSLVPFEYEGRQIRVISDELGDPWFVAADLLASLALDRKALERLDDDEKGVSSIHTPGGEQVMTIVNEPGMYDLVLGSRKKEAHRFKRWVTHEVLPTIRRAGTYSVTGTVPTPAVLPSEKQDSVGALLLIGQAIARLPGVKAGIAMAATLNCIQENTGLAVETLRSALPAAEEPICSLNATQLGRKVDMSARVMNQHLAACGLQTRNARDEWELTQRGQEWAEAMPYCRHGHSGYQILWNPAVVGVLRELA
jgi:prophage antirepressor-like protein